MKLVSITIPTYNSAHTLEACLESIAKQSYPDIETIVVDSNSSDETQEIARKYGAQIIATDSWLLGARVVGMRAAQGDYIVALDSDHVMSPTAIERGIGMMEDHDVLYLEERSLETHTLVQRLFDADRQLVQSQVDLHKDPLKGVLLGRFFRRDVLLEAANNISPEIVQNAVGFDHDILNYEVLKLAQNPALLPEAIWHQDPKTIPDLWRKNVRYGRTIRTMTHLGYYQDLLKSKAHPRLGAWKPKLLWLGFQSTLLLVIKAPALLIGYFLPPKKTTS